MASQAVRKSVEIKGSEPVQTGAKGRSLGYASPSILARRNRILTETRKMIAEVGLARLAMDDVARRANVAKRTLYNAFQSKEHLVATAISRYFEAYESKIKYTNDDATTLDWMVERLIIVARRNLTIRNYTRALMDSAFVPDPGQRRQIAPLAGEIPSPFALPPGCAFAGRCPRATDRCRAERPPLDGDPQQPVACFHPF